MNSYLQMLSYQHMAYYGNLLFLTSVATDAIAGCAVWLQLQ